MKSRGATHRRRWRPGGRVWVTWPVTVESPRTVVGIAYSLISSSVRAASPGLDRSTERLGHLGSDGLDRGVDILLVVEVFDRLVAQRVTLGGKPLDLVRQLHLLDLASYRRRTGDLLLVDLEGRRVRAVIDRQAVHRR